jgi:AraC family transcriptional regulator
VDRHAAIVALRDMPRFQNRALPIVLIEAAEVRCTRTAHDRADEESSALPTLVLPRRGLFRYHVGPRTTIADPNTVLLFHPREPYRISHPTDRGDDCIALRFDPDAVADALGFAGESAQAWTADARTHRALHGAADAVLCAHDALMREERAFEILALIGGAAPVAPNVRDAARIDAVRERLGAGASLAAIARDAGPSPFHLARRFRARTGTSLHQYRLVLRLAVAHSTLLEGADDLTRLALDLGFASPAHFSAAYRTAYGCSPSTVRKRRSRRDSTQASS